MGILPKICHGQEHLFSIDPVVEKKMGTIVLQWVKKLPFGISAI